MKIQVQKNLLLLPTKELEDGDVFYHPASGNICMALSEASYWSFNLNKMLNYHNTGIARETCVTLAHNPTLTVMEVGAKPNG